MYLSMGIGCEGWFIQADGDVDEDASEKGSEDTHSGAGR